MCSRSSKANSSVRLVLPLGRNKRNKQTNPTSECQQVLLPSLYAVEDKVNLLDVIRHKLNFITSASFLCSKTDGSLDCIWKPRYHWCKNTKADSFKEATLEASPPSHCHLYTVWLWLWLWLDAALWLMIVGCGGKMKLCHLLMPVIALMQYVGQREANDQNPRFLLIGSFDTFRQMWKPTYSVLWCWKWQLFPF